MGTLWSWKITKFHEFENGPNNIQDQYFTGPTFSRAKIFQDQGFTHPIRPRPESPGTKSIGTRNRTKSFPRTKFSRNQNFAIQEKGSNMLPPGIGPNLFPGPKSPRTKIIRDQKYPDQIIRTNISRTKISRTKISPFKIL